MMEDAPAELNFTMFLTLFGDKMTGTDPEDVIKNAFACFDASSTGKISEDRYVVGTAICFWLAICNRRPWAKAV
jgi:Ca2+-binding EF-hand superfamily protein